MEMYRDAEQIQTLTESVSLFLKKQREFNVMRRLRDRTGAWLNAFQRLSPDLSTAHEATLCSSWVEVMVQLLNFQIAAVYAVREDGRRLDLLQGLACVGPPISVELDPSAASFLESCKGGVYDGPGDEAEPLARTLNLGRFAWFTFSVDHRYDYLLIAGFSAQAERFHARLAEDDQKYFDMLGRHFMVLLRNACLLSELDRERIALRDQTQRLSMVNHDLRLANELANQLSYEAEAAGRAKAQFLTSMSHEIRTPLNGIIGMSEILLDSQLAEPQRECATVIDGSARTLLSLIGDILDFEKIQSGKLEPESVAFDIREVIDDCAAVCAVQAHRKGLELIAVVDDRVPRAPIGDAVRFRQILLNLVSNAVKFTDRGEVIIEVRLQSVRENRVELVLTVRDTGLGIDAATVSRLFQPFAQADPSMTRRYGGTGLGLAITKQLAGLMGGSIEVDSKLGEGSCFRVFLPLGTPDGWQCPPPEAPLQGRRVLLVEGNGALREMLGRQLHEAGAECSSVAAPSEAIALCRAGGRRFDFVILEMRVADGDPYELGRLLHSCPAASLAKIVALATPGAFDPDNPGAEIFSSSIMKPVRFARLLECLSQTLAPHPLNGSPQSPTAGFRPGLRVLVVEDNAVNRLVITRLLQRLGADVRVASDGKEALAAVTRESPEVVLMDCQMPLMDGFEATRQLRKREGDRQRIPVVALTANAMEGDRERCFAAGMDAYLTKPVRLEDLKRTVGRFFE